MPRIYVGVADEVFFAAKKLRFFSVTTYSMLSVVEAAADFFRKQLGVFEEKNLPELLMGADTSSWVISIKPTWSNFELALMVMLYSKASLHFSELPPWYSLLYMKATTIVRRVRFSDVEEVVATPKSRLPALFRAWSAGKFPEVEADASEESEYALLLHYYLSRNNKALLKHRFSPRWSFLERNLRAYAEALENEKPMVLGPYDHPLEVLCFVETNLADDLEGPLIQLLDWCHGGRGSISHEPVKDEVEFYYPKALRALAYFYAYRGEHTHALLWAELWVTELASRGNRNELDYLEASLRCEVWRWLATGSAPMLHKVGRILEIYPSISYLKHEATLYRSLAYLGQSDPVALRQAKELLLGVMHLRYDSNPYSDFAAIGLCEVMARGSFVGELAEYVSYLMQGNMVFRHAENALFAEVCASIFDPIPLLEQRSLEPHRDLGLGQSVASPSDLLFAPLDVDHRRQFLSRLGLTQPTQLDELVGQDPQRVFTVFDQLQLSRLETVRVMTNDPVLRALVHISINRRLVRLGQSNKIKAFSQLLSEAELHLMAVLGRPLNSLTKFHLQLSKNTVREPVLYMGEQALKGGRVYALLALLLEKERGGKGLTLQEMVNFLGNTSGANSIRYFRDYGVRIQSNPYRLVDDIQCDYLEWRKRVYSDINSASLESWHLPKSIGPTFLEELHSTYRYAIYRSLEVAQVSRAVNFAIASRLPTLVREVRYWLEDRGMFDHVVRLDAELARLDPLDIEPSAV